MTRQCTDCGDPIPPDEPRWKKRCLGCWRERQDDKDYAEAKGWDAGFKAGFQSASRVLDDLRPVMADAIQLCHPDRHPPERAQLANGTTAKLLELRRRLLPAGDRRAA
jgi:hypothetical protein